MTLTGCLDTLERHARACISTAGSAASGCTLYDRRPMRDVTTPRSNLLAAVPGTTAAAGCRAGTVTVHSKRRVADSRTVA